MPNFLKITIVFVSLVYSLSTFAESQQNFTAKDLNRELVMATLWTEVSGEYKAMAYQAFNLAKLSLDRYKAEHPSKTNFAVVVDVDETVLSNANYEAHLIKEGVYHSGTLQKLWADEAIAPAIPGAVDFLNYAKNEGAEVFYVTNRRENTLLGTLENLRKEGFPFADQQHILVKTDSSNKEFRREIIKTNFEIALLIGDNLRDFSEDFHTESLNNTANAVDQNKDLFGHQYIVLPNPMYGDWEGKIYNGNWRLSADEKSKRRHDNLDAWEINKISE